MSDTDLIDPRPSIRRHIVLGLAAVMLVAGGIGGWAATTEISGALIAPGSVVVESSAKKVQHPTGGVVGEIAVTNGMNVTAGDILIRLDETMTRANLQIVSKTLDEMTTRRARLAGRTRRRIGNVMALCVQRPAARGKHRRTDGR